MPEFIFLPVPTREMREFAQMICDNRTAAQNTAPTVLKPYFEKGMGKGIVQAILDGARQIAVPAFVSTLCICIVFVPVAFLTGTAKFLFTPLAMAVALAMGASYLLSRTLIPTLIRFLLPAELRLYRGPEGHGR